MGYKLADKTIESLQRVFHKEAIDRIASTLTSVEQKDGGCVKVTVNTHFGDFAGVMNEVTFVFDIGREVLPIPPLEHNKWLPIEKINSSVIDENVIFKDRSGELTLRNVYEADHTDNTILCRIDDSWHSLDNMTHFMIFDQ